MGSLVGEIFVWLRPCLRLHFAPASQALFHSENTNLFCPMSFPKQPLNHKNYIVMYLKKQCNVHCTPENFSALPRLIDSVLRALTQEKLQFLNTLFVQISIFLQLTRGRAIM